MVTPEAKANELGNKFYQGSVFDYDSEGHLEEKKKAKERALISVKDTIEVLESLKNIYWIRFYREVKQEINKL